MDLVTITNAGQPLVRPGSTVPVEGAVFAFDLLNLSGKQVGRIDTASGATVIGGDWAATDGSGVFSLDLPPNEGLEASVYRVTRTTQWGVEGWTVQIPGGGPLIQWNDLIELDVVLDEVPLGRLNLHLADEARIHLSSDERAGLDAAPNPASASNPIATKSDLAAGGGHIIHNEDDAQDYPARARLAFSGAIIDDDVGGGKTIVAGLQGPQGVPGADGPAGADGADGAQGLPGADGADGAQGLPGADGVDGAQGLPGADGAAGADGAQGLPGADGPAGADGADGAEGSQGVQGLPGATGDTGPQGIQGDPGASGDTGPQGAPGVVQSVVGGAGISVDATDPANPVVAVDDDPVPLDIQVVLSAAGADIAAGLKQAVVRINSARTLVAFMIDCDPANEPAAATVQVDLNRLDLDTGAATSVLSAVASISIGANAGSGSVNGTQTFSAGDKLSLDIDQGSDGKELLATLLFTPL